MASQSQLFFGSFLTFPTSSAIEVKTGAVLVVGEVGHAKIEVVDWDVKTVDEAREKVARAVGESAPAEGGLKVFESGSGWFVPGFIVVLLVQDGRDGRARALHLNVLTATSGLATDTSTRLDTHIHAPQYPNSGIFGKSTLLDWLETYTFPLESSLGNVNSPAYKNSTSRVDPLSRAKAVYDRVITRTLSHGTTTASYYATIHVPATNLLADLARSKGQRAYIGRVCMDNPDMCPDYYRDESAEQSIANTLATMKHCEEIDPSGELIAPILTPRFAPSCTRESLSRLGALAKERDVRVQTHISENMNEIKLVADLFPDQKSYAEVYDVHGLLTDRTILAHCVHLSDEEIALVKARGSKVSHCPASNSALGSGMCPVRKLLDSGLDIGLGTDVSGGYSSSILEAVRQAFLVSRHVGFLNGGDGRYNVGIAEGLWLATVGGAKVVGMEGKLGEFKEGMYWDVQEIQLGETVGSEERSDEPVDEYGWESTEDKVAKWVWTGDDRNVRRVWVGGRLVHQRK